MNEAPQNFYCPEQIDIPVTFPYILKLYAKSAIRTQPYDLLRWTSAYFRALANGQPPPVKRRLEYPPFSRPCGITPGYLKILLNQFSQSETVEIEVLLERWKGIDLPESSLYQILMIGDFLRRGCALLEFIAIGCGFLGNNLFETMVYICEVISDEPEGGAAMIPLKRFIDLYVFIANIHCADPPLSTQSSDVEEEAYSAYEAFDPSNVALPGSRRESHFDSTECSDTSDRTTEANSQCSGGENGETNPIGTCGDEQRSIEQLPPDESNKSRSPSSALAVPQSSRRSSAAAPDEISVSVSLTSPRSKIKSIYDDLEREDDAYETFEGYGEEEAEEGKADMETYEPIGLETLLGGICECLEPGVEVEEPEPAPDPVEEFLVRMRAAFPPPFVNPVVPGIGPVVPEDRVTAVCLWLADCARRQSGLVGPRNIRHFLCPALEAISKYEEAEETLFKCL